MILYFTKNYILISLLLAIVLILINTMAGMQNVILKSFVWSGLVSGYAAYFLFEKKNLWILYYNLRIPQFSMVGINIILFEIISVTLILLIQGIVN